MFKELLTGALLTFSLTGLALTFGFLLAIFWIYGLNTKNRFLKIPIQGFINFTRSVPLLVQFFLLYYGSNQPPFLAAVIALGLNSSAYTAILLNNQIQTIPKGEIETCQVLGLSYFSSLYHIILPRALAHFWPVYSNEAIMVLKSTSLASTITLLDLMGVTREIIAKTYQPFEALLFAGILYCLMSGILKIFIKWIHFNAIRQKIGYF